MNANLGPVFEQFVAELVDSGLYQSQSEVIREGLRLLKEREELKKLRLEELRREIARGSAEADRGELVDGPEAFRKIRRRRPARRAS
ncbi:MAG TPA: type II toxin-antitoxin system ParD family antitoxin [Terriglobia bacterium]|nr:type II toxin-antitoxin system ParD family antitoxin [Terriglobia bacterium]